MVCDYEIPCAHPSVELIIKEDVGWKEPEQVDESYHMVRRYNQVHYRCRDCGKEWGWDYPDYEKKDPVKERHIWNDEGICKICGYKNKCYPHDYKLKEDGKKVDGTVACESLGATRHKVTIGSFQELECTKFGFNCKRCDTWWGYEVTKYGVERELPHEWDTNNGSHCVICGYKNTCTHEDYEEYEDEDYRLIPSMTTATTHSINPFGVVGKRCNNCGADFERRATGSTDTIVTEPHKFVHQGGKTVCEVCGYIKPEKKAESSEKTEIPEEIAFEEIAEGTVVHGATVGEPTRMGVTMVQAMAGIAAEYGAGTVVEIQNIDKVLTADECAALNALPPTERILVALSAIGYGDEVKNALAELQLTLSEEARVLSLKVNTRMALMNDAAKAAHQKAIEQYFPNANGVAITLKIRKAGESGARLERYGFTPSNGEWVFAKLEVAKA